MDIALREINGRLFWDNSKAGQRYFCYDNESKTKLEIDYLLAIELRLEHFIETSIARVLLDNK